MKERKGKISLRKIFIALLSLAMVVGFVILFVAASQNKQEGSCRGIMITLNKGEQVDYVDTANIRKEILTSAHLNPIGKPLDELQGLLLKEKIANQKWVKKAEVYLGNNNLLNIRIKQKVPLSRIFRTDGSSFYLTKSGEQVEANGRFAVNLPVFTGFPKRRDTKKDTILLKQIKKMSKFIAHNEFWKAQIEQIAIHKGEFDLIPQVGDALILFGKGKDIASKFEKLMIFYKKGLDNIGWGFYDTLDLRFEGQIVAVRKDSKGNPVVNALVRENDPESKKMLQKLEEEK